MPAIGPVAKSETLPVGWPDWPGDEWWRSLAGSTRAVLMLDYDGTLAPFVRERLHAVLYPGVTERLLQLARLSRLRLVFVSGRQAHVLLSLLPVELHPEIWGSHGREHLLPDGGYEMLPLTPLQTDALAWFDTAVVDAGASAALEIKPGSRAIHTRGLAAIAEQRLVELVNSLFLEIKDQGFDWLAFDGGIEVRAAGRSKAGAVDDILRGESGTVVAAYLGDDRTDEEAFHAQGLHSLDQRGLRVLVKEAIRPSAADLWLRPPDDLLAFLDCWLSALLTATTAAKRNPSL